MFQGFPLRAPFFEIGPKAYLVGQDVVDLARAADEASERYNVDIIFTASFTDLVPVAQATRRIHLFAPHMDPIRPGRGVWWPILARKSYSPRRLAGSSACWRTTPASG